MSKAFDKLLALYAKDSDDEKMNYCEAVAGLIQEGLWNGASALTMFKKRGDEPDPLEDILITEIGGGIDDAEVNVVELKKWLGRRSHRIKRRPKAASKRT